MGGAQHPGGFASSPGLALSHERWNTPQPVDTAAIPYSLFQQPLPPTLQGQAEEKHPAPNSKVLLACPVLQGPGEHRDL